MKTPFLAVLLSVFLTPPAFAQSTDDRIRISFGGAMTAGAIDGEGAFAISAGYRFLDHFSFEVEVTAADEPAGGFANPFFGPTSTVGTLVTGSGSVTNVGRTDSVRSLPAVIRSLPNVRLPPPIGLVVDLEGSTVLATAGFRYEMPVQGTRFRPYLSGGIGVARTESSFERPDASGGNVSAIPSAAVVFASFPLIDLDTAHTGLVGSAGLGATLRVFRGLSVDLNARYFRLDRSRNLGSFGGGVSYRF
ncbi:MAG: outer membrane beta-barrel protein [Vicinamibacterales bacterium]